MPADKKPQRYIIMSPAGFTDPALFQASFRPSTGARPLAARAAASFTPQMRVLDAIHEDGPKLVEMPPEGELSLRLQMPGVKIVPEVFYRRQWYRPEVLAGPVQRMGAARAATRAAAAPVQVVDRASGKPVRGASVIAFTDFASRAGADGKSDARGQVRLANISPGQKLERLYGYGPPGYWGFYRTSTSLSANAKIKLRPVDIHADTLLLRVLYGALPATAGNGVSVAIIDSGVDGTHPDLANVTGGENCVTDEILADPAAKANWRPSLVEGEHGTHVAGTVAARPAAQGFRGVAPGATLRSYRVFPDSGGGGSNYDIAKAIDRAVADQCHIINMSLGGGAADDLTRSAIQRAVNAGVLVVCAAGNDDRSPVSYPAAFPECTAVSAMGRRGSFPSESGGTADVAKPRGTSNGDDFVAAFSNFGPQIDVTGPGVEIVSTLPGGHYGPMSGTSMATPAVAGFAAHLLSSSPAIQNAQGADRSRQLKDLLYSKAKPAGFGRDYEGFGLPLP
jgi:subtilisin